MNNRITGLCLLFLLLGTTGRVAQAQAGATPYVDPFDARICEGWRAGFETMEVYALGAVESNCRWTVNRDIPFLDFLTMIRPRGLEANETFDATPIVIVQIFRESGPGRVLSYEATVEDILTSVAPMPTLEPQDIVLVKLETIRKRRVFTFANVSAVLGTVSTTLLLYLRLKDGPSR